jgi:hypothetical protein
MDNLHYVMPDEALQKYCVFPAFNGRIQKACTGTACMAWRWAEINDPQIKEGQWDDSTSGGWFTLGWKKQYSTTHGYCGMVRP